MTNDQHADPHTPTVPPAPLIPLIDPTANVLSLVKVAIDHQNELRQMAERLREVEVRRLDELRDLTRRCAEEIQAVHLKAASDLAVAETGRIDALLLAAKAERGADTEKAASTAAALATAVANSAEVQRSTVATLATQISTQTAQMREALEKRLQLLEQSQYAIGGRDTQRIESRTSGAQSTGVVIAVVGAIFGAIGTLAGIAVAAITLAAK